VLFVLVKYMGKLLAGRDAALRDADDAVHPGRVHLRNAVEMETGELGAEVVADTDTQGVAGVGLNEWPRGLVGY